MPKLYYYSFGDHGKGQVNFTKVYHKDELICLGYELGEGEYFAGDTWNGYTFYDTQGEVVIPASEFPEWATLANYHCDEFMYWLARKCLTPPGYLQSILPRLVDNKKMLVEFYASEEHYTSRRVTKVKLGKFLRKISPGLKDSTIERLVDLAKETFGPKDYTFKRSDKSEVFAEVYSTPLVKGSNFPTTRSGKSLANSCMQNKHWDYSNPMVVYGSGDFEIFYLVDSQGNSCCKNYRIQKDKVLWTCLCTNILCTRSSERSGKKPGLLYLGRT